MKKILIMDNNEALLKQLQTNITKYDVLVATTIEDAIKILESEDISFFVVDLDLGHEKTGDIAYDLIFSKGKSIPAIVFSGKPISDEVEEYLLEKGFSAVRGKGDPNQTDSDLVEEAADKILKDCKERAKQVKKNVKKLNIGKRPLFFNKEFKTINGWIKAMEECELIDQEEELKTKIIDVWRAIRKKMDGYEFEEMF